MTKQQIVAIIKHASNIMKHKGVVNMREWLIEARRKKGFTQEQVATNCGISRQYYSFIESGDRNAPVKTAKKIAEILGFDWQKFFECEGGLEC